jgi:hypothetical protein
MLLIIVKVLANCMTGSSRICLEKVINNQPLTCPAGILSPRGEEEVSISNY